MFLDRIREKSKGLVGGLIIGLIAITFALFGIDQYLGGGSAPPVATINGTDLTPQQFQQALLQRQQQMREMFGNNVPAGMLDPESLREPVLQGLIQNELLTQTTQEFGYGVSDKQVAEAIRNIPAFQDNGQFSSEKYNRLLEQQRRSKAAFEAQVRNGMRLEQFGETFQGSSFLPGPMLKDFLRLREQQRQVKYLIVDKQGFADDVTVNEAEIKEHYEKNTAQYMTQEQVKLHYLALDENALAEQVSIDEQGLQDIYENEMDRFKTTESRNARHILFKLAEPDNAEAVKKVEAEAQALYDRIKAGESFEELAAENSQDDLSNQQGGDLGEVFSGDLSAQLEQTIFSLQAGDVSLPVQTPQGLHIVKVDSIQGGEQQSFAEAKSAIEQEYRAREAETQLVEKSEQLLTLTYEDSGSLDPAADALGIEVKTSDWITRNGSADALAREPRVLQAAFSTEVLQEGKNSDVIALGDGRQLVIRIAEHEPAKPEALEAVTERIRIRLADEKQQQLASEKAAGLLQTLKDNKSDIAALANENGYQLQTADTLTRQSRDIPPELATEIFQMKKPAEGSHSYTSLAMADGNQAVIQLEKVTDPADTTDSKELETIANILGNSYGQREIQAVFQAMEARSDIQVFKENIDQQQQ